VDNGKPVNVQIGVKPVFAALVHSGAYEGPCRTGDKKSLAPDTERAGGRKRFREFEQNVSNSVKGARVLDAAYIEYGEDFMVPERELKKLESDLDETDLYLLAYRVPGIERYRKPVAMVGRGVTNMDVAAYMRSRGLEGYAPLDFDELNELISLLQVRKALRQTRILVVSEGELITWGVVSSIWDLEDVKRRFGVDSVRIPFAKFCEEMDSVDRKKAEELADKLIGNAQESHMSKDNVAKSVIAYMAAKNLLGVYACSAFTIPCFELCARRIPAERKFTPCLTHSLLKDEGYPSACEGDLSVLLSMAVLMYVSKESAYMGNAAISDQAESILRVGHDVPGLKMKGFDGPDLPYEIRNFTFGGWGATIRYDFSQDKGEQVTLARFDPTATRLLVTRGEIVGCSGFDQIGCTLTVYIKVPNVTDFLHRQVDFGHHFAMVYGDFVHKVETLAQLMKFEVVKAV